MLVSLSPGEPRQRRKLKPAQRASDLVHHRAADVVSETIGGVDERDVACLVGLQSLILDEPGVVLDQPFGDHHVTHIQVRIQAARDAGENHCAATEPVRQNGRDQRRVDLAHTGFGEDDVAPVERTDIEARVRDVHPLDLAHRAA